MNTGYRRPERVRTRRPADQNQMGDLIRQLRTERSMTQAQLADAAQVNQRTISAIELGVSEGSVDSRKRIADALGVDVVVLFKKAGDF